MKILLEEEMELWNKAIDTAIKHCKNLEKAYGGISERPIATEAGKLLHEAMAAGAHNCAVGLRALKVKRGS